MDSISQFVLGSACGELTLGNKLGRKAILWGGLIGTLPDLDILSGYWMDELSKTEFHRGPSHSILFCLVMAYPIAGVIKWIHSKAEISFHRYAFFVFITLFTHILLDLCTTWGTKVLWPFDQTAYAWQIIFVLDPLYTLPFLMALIVSPFIVKKHHLRWKLWFYALILSTAYLLVCSTSKLLIRDSFTHSFRQIQEPISYWSSRPSPLNNILWTAIAETDLAFYSTYHSHFDASNYQSELFRFEKNQSLRDKWKDNPTFKRIVTMTKGQYLMEQLEDGLLIKDLRFGQNAGWMDINSDFVFQYLVKGTPEDPYNLVTRIPPSMGDREKALGSLFERIKGLP